MLRVVAVYSQDIGTLGVEIPTVLGSEARSYNAGLCVFRDFSTIYPVSLFTN